ncbi:MAG: DUF1385 domain-containing protein [Synergistaceae bacterium]|nr:DUF1385 domain-containing protein [Synergistaceae bacterium]MBQ3399406.1 DUF1385 domain-containing protein [Synergistaceae bacterium]
MRLELAENRTEIWRICLIKRLYLWLILALNLFADDPERKIPVGGQAVIEGVLMKGKTLWGLAVRRPSGDIFTETWPNSSRIKRMPYKLPLIRGVVVMCEMMATGFKALSKSAEVALEEEQEKMTAWDIISAVALAIFAVGGLFIALPLWLAGYFATTPLYVNITEGVLRAVIFVGYVAVIGLWKDIREIFRYHGAEHKTINAFEHGLEMTPENIMTCSRIHPRCGTSFLLIAVIVSIIIFSPVKTLIAGESFALQVLARIILIPVVVGISYEIIKLASNSGKFGLCIIAPFLTLQYLTTREPDINQAEVALVSLNTAMEGGVLS